MDEEYHMLQADLCFYQASEKDSLESSSNKLSSNTAGAQDSEKRDNIDNLSEKFRYRELNMTKAAILKERRGKIFVPIEFEDDLSEKFYDSRDEITSTLENVNKIPTKQSVPKLDCRKSNAQEIVEATTSTAITLTNADGKNEVIIKSFFGATKNAIFRTAQSIIDNHEKKSWKNKDKDEKDVKLLSCETPLKKKEFSLLRSNKNHKQQLLQQLSTVPSTMASTPLIIVSSDLTPEVESKVLAKSPSINSLNCYRDKNVKVPGIAHCFIQEDSPQLRTECGKSGLLRFFESPVFNIHFAVHYLFYSKEPGVLSFIGNKIFSFPDIDVDLYIPQLTLMYIQMHELAEVLDPYLVYRCRRSADFSLKCAWLLEAYHFNTETLSFSHSSTTNKKRHVTLMQELFPKRVKRIKNHLIKFNGPSDVLSPFKKTHHRSQSDASGLLGSLHLTATVTAPVKLCLGDLTTGRAFDNGCLCFETVRGTVNGLLGHQTVCTCGAPKLAPEKEFMKSLIDIGKMLTSLPTKIEKTSRLRVLLNLINKNLPARVWLPLNSELPHHVVRITEEKTAVLNSKDKTPYIIYVEVVEVNDIYTSKVIQKLMPTLRHTKSEEHLDTVGHTNDEIINDSSCTIGDSKKNVNEKTSFQQKSHPPLNSKLSLSPLPASLSSKKSFQLTDFNEMAITDDEIWSIEDDEITDQYLNLHKTSDRDTISHLSLDSSDSREQSECNYSIIYRTQNTIIDIVFLDSTLFNIGDVRFRHCANLYVENTRPFSNDPEDPSAAALKVRVKITA
jgi:phosphatidylinositol 4-kinase B